MKIYVTNFTIKPEYKQALKSGDEIPQKDCYDIRYDIEPLWKFPYKELADGELGILQSMNVHVGNHYCQLEVEQVGEEAFAIVCNDHPDPKQR